MWAANKGEAIELLDEVDNAEGCPLTPLGDFLVHFRLSDEGEIQFDGFGEATENALFEHAYPVLDDTLSEAPTDPAGNTTPEGQAMIREAVGRERKRVRPKKVKEPQTELGGNIKKMTGAPTRIIDWAIKDTARKRLKGFHGQGKPN